MAAGAIAVGTTVVHRKAVPARADIPPTIRSMALGALTLPVTRRAVVTGLAVVTDVLVAEVGRPPGVGAVTVGALPTVVISGSIPSVAGLAVGCVLVAEIGRPPGIGAVTVGTLPG